MDSTTLRQAILYYLDGLHTCVPARIVSFDAVKQEASVQVLINDFLMDDRNIEVPIIDGVPVMFPSSGGGYITFPVEKGDTVLLVFSERSLDVFLGSKTTDPRAPIDKRRHNITDAIAIPGLYPFTLAPGIDQTAAVVHYSGSTVKLKANGDVEINPATGNLIVNGTITATNDVVAQGGEFGDVSLKDHQHKQSDPTALTSKPNEPI